MIRHRSDLASLAVALAAAALPMVHVAAGWRSPWLVAAGVPLAYLALVANHNHQHLAVFRPAWANRIYELVLTLGGGLPGSILIPLHNRNHHRERNGPGDFMPTTLVARWPRPLRLPAYPVAAALAWAPRRRAELARCRREQPAIWWRITAQRVLLAAAMVAGLVWRPLDTLLAAALPWTLAQFWVMNAIWLQHADCDPADDAAHTRDFTGRWLNRLTFNGGYHLEHHDHPGVHWSRLPGLHAERRARIPPAQLEPSFPRVVLRALMTGSPRRRA